LALLDADEEKWRSIDYPRLVVINFTVMIL